MLRNCSKIYVGIWFSVVIHGTVFAHFETSVWQAASHIIRYADATFMEAARDTRLTAQIDIESGVLSTILLRFMVISFADQKHDVGRRGSSSSSHGTR